MSNVVALDLETTGFDFKSKDRVIEIAGCVINPSTGQIISKFETLINPLRNIPEQSVKIHSLTAAHLSMAPTFSEIGPWLANTIGGKRVVAHNALFDVNFLNAEFIRAGIDFQITEFDCTCRLTKNASLKAAALDFDLDYSPEKHHGALYDAYLCSQIYTRLITENIVDGNATSNRSFELAAANEVPSLITREQLSLVNGSRKKQSPLTLGTSPHLDNPAEACYLWRLTEFLGDLELTELEKRELYDLAQALGISPAMQHKIHESYVRELEKAAQRDGLITNNEEELLRAFAEALEIELKVDFSKSEVSLPPVGSLICVTGTTTINGENWGKKEISSFLVSRGFQFTDELSKSSGVSMLLQESEGSQSGKVEKARKWGIPRMTIESFVSILSNT